MIQESQRRTFVTVWALNRKCLILFCWSFRYNSKDWLTDCLLNGALIRCITIPLVPTPQLQLYNIWAKMACRRCHVPPLFPIKITAWFHTNRKGCTGYTSIRVMMKILEFCLRAFLTIRETTWDEVFDKLNNIYWAREITGTWQLFHLPTHRFDKWNNTGWSVWQLFFLLRMARRTEDWEEYPYIENVNWFDNVRGIAYTYSHLQKCPPHVQKCPPLGGSTGRFTIAQPLVIETLRSHIDKCQKTD